MCFAWMHAVHPDGIHAPTITVLIIVSRTKVHAPNALVRVWVGCIAKIANREVVAGIRNARSILLIAQSDKSSIISGSQYGGGSEETISWNSDSAFDRRSYR